MLTLLLSPILSIKIILLIISLVECNVAGDEELENFLVNIILRCNASLLSLKIQELIYRPRSLSLTFLIRLACIQMSNHSSCYTSQCSTCLPVSGTISN